MPSPDQVARARRVLNYRLLEVTQKYIGVTYGLGCKPILGQEGMKFQTRPSGYASCNGNMVDCSGYISGAFTLALGGFPQEFQRLIQRALATDSERQITAIRKLGSPLWRADEMTSAGFELLPGMLIGIDTAKAGFDAGRPMGIDHIVAIVHNGGDGTVCIIQSSSGGVKIGVNMVSFEDWRTLFARAFAANKVYCVDIFAVTAFDLPATPPGDGANAMKPRKGSRGGADIDAPFLDSEITRMMESAGPS